MGTMKEMLTIAPVIPVVSIVRKADAVPLVEALLAGGLPVIEVTLRTPVALDAIADIRARVKDAVVGVGTLTRPEQFSRARDAGAHFAVSPGLTAPLLEAARMGGLPYLPGIMTPSELARAGAAGFSALKLFPAELAGGVGLLKALAGPFPEAIFCPTGGISIDNLGSYLAQDNVACAGGSWLAPADAVAAGDWAAITRLAREAVELAATVRAGRSG